MLLPALELELVALGAGVEEVAVAGYEEVKVTPTARHIETAAAMD